MLVPSASLRALLTGVIDYAGLFPPASLSLEQSIANYARYRNEPESWMLGRFICPAARLRELLPDNIELFTPREPLRVSALGRAAKSADQFNVAVKMDMADMAAFREAATGRAVIEGFETRMPASGGMTLPGPSRDIFLEWTLAGPDWRRAVQFGSRIKACGFKLRTGGVEAAAFPSVEQVAHVI